MTTFIAYANIQQPFPFDEIPTDLVPENLRTEPQGNSRITQRHQCRRLAHFLLWQLLKTAGKSTALFDYFNKYARNCAKSSSISSESNGNLLCLSKASGNGRSSERIRSTDSLNFAGCAVHKKIPVSSALS